MAIDAMTTDPVLGLTSQEVEERIASGQTNQLPSRTSRTYAGIIRSNVFTRFNLIISMLASGSENAGAGCPTCNMEVLEIRFDSSGFSWRARPSLTQGGKSREERDSRAR